MDALRGTWLSFALSGLLLGGGSAAAETGPRTVIEQTTGELLKAVADERQAILDDPDRAQKLVERIVLPHVDMQIVGRWLLGRHWRKATPEQREQFLEEFRKLLVRTYATALAEFTGGTEITYISERVSDDGEQAVVRTQIPLPGKAKPVDVVYRLHRKNDGWKAFDVVVEGVSMIATYRTTIRNTIQRRGLNAVIEDLAEKNREGEVADTVAAKRQQ
ncbi:MAG: ABC transporter substrate-binding protein [Gammaproteobacteria bacterium]|nr:ABC transporter substrate-binding protein [Gammaproteobacteria bacterium]